MFLYITSGTPDYMEKLQIKYKKENMILLYGVSNALLLHETEGKTKFATPRKYEVVTGLHSIEQSGFFALHHIPVEDEAKPVFEQQLVKGLQFIGKEPGLISFRFLRPKKSDTYVILTQWIGRHSYEAWKNSRTFKELEQSVIFGEKKQNIFDAASYINTYSGKKNKSSEN